MTALLLTLTLALFHWVGPVPADLGVRSGALSPCVSPAHDVTPFAGPVLLRAGG